MVLGGKNKIFPPNDTTKARPSMQKCYELLNKTSRSFAAVIQALDEELRPAITIFYLVLRGLDTVEDDMTIDNKEKIALLNVFHEKMYEEGWTFDGNGPKVRWTT
jgi:farnesyl-diphosphate farnesyltransferase